MLIRGIESRIKFNEDMITQVNGSTHAGPASIKVRSLSKTNIKKYEALLSKLNGML